MMQLSGRDGTAEFNVDPKEDTFRLTMDGVTKTFKIIDLWALTFAMVGPEHQEKMMPVRQTELVTYRGFHKIKLKKNMNKGDILTARYEMNVPQTVVEGLNGMIEQEKVKRGIPLIGVK